MKNIKRNKKALSPVVASIILVAVTVAVSIAVAAWMGALTVGFMDTEQIEIREIDFDGTSGVTVTARNTGTSAVIIREVWVNNVEYTGVATTDTLVAVLPDTIPDNDQIEINIPYASLSWVAGNNYQVKLITAKGNPFLENAIPPT